MDLSAIIVVIALTALALGTIVGLEIYSRKIHRKEASEETYTDRTGLERKGTIRRSAS